MIVDAAKITKQDTVLEVGTGRGILTPLLCSRALRVVSAEADKDLYSDALLEFSGIENLELVRGDGFETDAQFTVFVSNLPYSESKRAIEWLAGRKFQRAVIMVQKEFADKLVSGGGKDMRAISVVARHAFEIDKILDVGKNNFVPPPKVDSTVLYLKKKNTVSPKLMSAVSRMFSYRRKTVTNIAKKFGKDIALDKRVDELSAEEAMTLAKSLL